MHIAAAIGLLITSGSRVVFRLLVVTLATLLMVRLRVLPIIRAPHLLMPARHLVATITTLSIDIVALLVLAHTLFTPELPRLQVTFMCWIAFWLLVPTVTTLNIPGMALLILVFLVIASRLLLRMWLGHIGAGPARRIRVLGGAGQVLRMGLPGGLVGEGVDDFPGTEERIARPIGAAAAAAARACGELSGKFAKKSRHGGYCEAGGR